MYFQQLSFWAYRHFYGQCIPYSGGFCLLPLQRMAQGEMSLCSRVLGKQQDKKWALLIILHIFSWTLWYQIHFLLVKSKFTVFYFKSFKRSPNPLFPPIFLVSWGVFFIFHWENRGLQRRTAFNSFPNMAASLHLSYSPPVLHSCPDPSLPSCSGMFLWPLSCIVIVALAGSFPQSTVCCYSTHF